MCYHNHNHTTKKIMNQENEYIFYDCKNCIFDSRLISTNLNFYEYGCKGEGLINISDSQNRWPFYSHLNQHPINSIVIYSSQAEFVDTCKYRKSPKNILFGIFFFLQTGQSFKMLKNPKQVAQFFL